MGRPRCKQTETQQTIAAAAAVQCDPVLSAQLAERGLVSLAFSPCGVQWQRQRPVDLVFD